MKKTIYRRLLGLSLLSIFLTALALTGVFYTRLKEQIFSDLSAVAEVIEADGFSNQKTERIRVTVINEDGSVRYDSYAGDQVLANHGSRPEVRQAKEQGEGKSVRRSDTLSESIFYYAIRQEDGTILRVGKEARSVWAIWLSVMPIAALIAVILAGVSFVLSRYLTLRVTGPIDEMAQDLDHIREDGCYPELLPFIRKIKAQHEEIVSASNIRQEFTANVSHELKTPLAAISGYAELMETGVANQKDVKHFSGEIRKSAGRLLNLINDIIKISELDSEHAKETLEVVNFARIAEESVEMLQIEASKTNVKLSFEGDGEALVRIGREYARELTYNLIENAIRYNKPDGDVFVRVENREQDIRFTVRDSGVGIPQEHIKRIFERFYRVDRSRSRELGGTGLGLAIAKHICTLTEAVIDLQSQVGVGTVVTVSWKKLAKPEDAAVTGRKD